MAIATQRHPRPVRSGSAARGRGDRLRHDTSAGRAPLAAHAYIYGLSGATIVVIAVSVVLASVLSPTMVTGSHHDQVQTAFSDYLWGAIAAGAVGLTAMAGTKSDATTRGPWVVLCAGGAAIWVGVLVASVLAPVLVARSDPTSLPLAVIAAPVAGVILTGVLCRFVAEAVRA